MSNSLQDQLLGAGLVDKKKAKKITKQKQKQKNIDKRTNSDSFSEAKNAAHHVQQQKKQKDLDLNRKRNEEAERKAIAAQIEQLIAHYKIDRQSGDQEYNFADGKNIKKILVSQEYLDQLSRGRLCIVRYSSGYELIPKPIAEKIAERDETKILVNNSQSQQQDASTSAEDDAYYAQFEIPDDLMW